MTKLKPGDRVSCRISLGNIISPYAGDYDQVITFEIVAKDITGCYVFVPSYIYLNGSVKADAYFCNLSKIDRKYIGDNIMYIEESMIYKISFIVDGCICVKCKDFSYQAEPNQEDGSFTCFCCRQNIYR